MTEKMQQLREILGEVADLDRAAGVLGWDRQTYMPPGGAEARGHQLGTLGKLMQEKFASDEVGRLLEDLQAEVGDGDSDDAALIRVTRRDYEKARRVPPEFVVEQAQVTTRAFDAWREARQKADFSIFAPHLEKVVDLVRRYISFFPPAVHPYDTLLDNFEPGMKTAEVQEIFQALRPRQVALLQAIASRKQVDSSMLDGRYNEKKMEQFSVAIATKFGFDWTRGRQDRAPHPFETTFSIKDVRITTRFEKDNPTAMLFSTMHETGHALYEMGGNPAYERTPLMGGASHALHESQSRLWENMVGRSMPFWRHFYPQLKKLFPVQLDGVGLKSFYRAINKVEPSFIRVNADEATYNMHIMLRLELEIAMVEDAIRVKDLPEAWNQKMQGYLGIRPENDAMGVLQDMHWSGGSIGYFSTYALGNLVSAQLWEKINQDLPGLSEEIAKGQFDSLLGWLRKNLHIYGRKYEPQQLVKMITGDTINPDAYIRYLTAKYSEVYGL
jgi:carboxypeptidase Taq